MKVKILSVEEFDRIGRSPYLYAPTDNPEEFKVKKDQWENQPFVKFLEENNIPHRFQWEQVGDTVYIENRNNILDRFPYSKVKEIK